jgi:Suppressor of fused protein (SUFU)
MSAFWTDAYQRHFQHYFAKPFDIHAFQGPGGAALKLAIYDGARPSFCVFASIGLADRLSQNDEKDVGEVILFADSADSEIPQLFVNALFFILHRRIPLGSRFALGFGEMGDRFAQRYGKTALYFTRPAEDDKHFAAVEHGESVGRVFQAYFITPEEDEFIEQQGADAFEEEFWQQFGEPLTDEERCELAVDKAKLPTLEKLLNERWRECRRALSVRRPSCV